MDATTKGKVTAYDRYINYKLFSIAVAAFVIIMMIPMPESMRDVGVEYAVGKNHVQNFISKELFGKASEDAEQWQALTAKILDACMIQGIQDKEMILKKDQKALKTMKIDASSKLFDKYYAYVQSMDADYLKDLLKRSRELRYDKLTYNDLSDSQKEKADKAANNLKVCVALIAFVVICFMTEAMPLPGVAFCIGLILVFFGVVSRKEVAGLFWDDACWFIMGSLMFAAAFVKTGVDKRICLFLFKSLAKPSINSVILIFIVVMAPASSFISDHALTAMFLPIAIILYNNSLNSKTPVDLELAKMLMITICMAPNIGGFGAPSGGARNIIMMTYFEDMFGMSFGYGQWILFGMPFVLLMIPILYFLVIKRFKPQIKDLGPALDTLKLDIDRMGGWSAKQIIAVIIFVIMLFCWITEENLLKSILGVRLGIGVLAIAGAVAYLLAGVVNWRDYQEKVDWGVVWLYAGAIIFGKVLDDTGAAYWLARSVVGLLSTIGLNSGFALLATGSAVTAGMTNLMADGPAAACVGPITLSMAAVSNPGTTLLPFMALATACSSSFAYLLVIGTPPNAIAYSSGYLGPKDFLRVGIPCFLCAFVLLFLLSMFYWPLLGFGNLPAY